MPPGEDGNGSLIRELLKASLRLSAKASFEDRMPAAAAAFDIRPDHIIRDGDVLYLVDVRNYATERSIANLALLKQLLKDTKGRIRYVLAAKNISGSVQTLAEKIPILVVQLPLSIPLTVTDEEGRITTEKAWKVVAALLSMQLTSIRRISKMTGVSYGWAHGITNRLISKGIAEKFNGQVRITNHGKLLNAVSLERPMAGMNKGEIRTGYSSSHDAAAGLTGLLERSGIQFAFTGFTAASIYMGSAVRHDGVYLYLKDMRDYPMLKSNEAHNLRGIRVHIYKPDRDVTTGSRKVQDVRVVSKQQALLDMAGFGRSNGELALEMARNYGSIVDNG